MSSEIILPSNRKFGLFFTVIFLSLGIYFFQLGPTILGVCFILLSFLFVITTIFRDDLLLPLNRAWMLLGTVIGAIVNPLILGLMFVTFFVTTGFLFRLIGRDELRLKENNPKTYWIEKPKSNYSSRSKLQF